MFKYLNIYKKNVGKVKNWNEIPAPPCIYYYTHKSRDAEDILKLEELYKDYKKNNFTENDILNVLRQQFDEDLIPIHHNVQIINKKWAVVDIFKFIYECSTNEYYKVDVCLILEQEKVKMRDLCNYFSKIVHCSEIIKAKDYIIKML